MKKLIGKKTNKMTTETIAKKIFNDLPLEKKEQLYYLLGRIVCEEVKNFYSTKVYKGLVKDLNRDQIAVISFICKKESIHTAFEDMKGLELTEG